MIEQDSHTRQIANAVACMAVFVSSEEGKEFYREAYKERLTQWPELSAAERRSNARADVFRDVQAQCGASGEGLVSFDVLQDSFTLNMFRAKDPYKVAVHLCALCGVDEALVGAEIDALLALLEEGTGKLHCLTDEQLAALPRTPEVQLEIQKRLYESASEAVEAWNEQANEIISIEDAAAELGWSLEEMLEQLVKDGLLLEVDGELVPSPHPDIQRTS